MVKRMRFERAKQPSLGAKLFSRSDVNPALDMRDALDLGAFLGRLWAHFGPAKPSDDGFTYYLRDRETGIAFSAYSGASGPSYGGDDADEDILRPAIVELEKLLAKTKPVDCQIAYTLDIDYGGAQCVVGC